jgi:hypothetical protein
MNQRQRRVIFIGLVVLLFVRAAMDNFLSGEVDSDANLGTLKYSLPPY